MSLAIKIDDFNMSRSERREKAREVTEEVEKNL